MRINPLLYSILVFFALSSANAQLSFLSKIDSFPGTHAEFAPLPEGYIVFNSAYNELIDFAFMLSKFDKCGAVEWTKKYRSENSFYHNFGSPEVVMDKQGDLYMLLSHSENQGEGITLSKLNQRGIIEWSYHFYGTEASNLSSRGNILYNKFSDTLVFTINNALNEATIVKFDKDGSPLAVKSYPGMSFHSSQIHSDGSIIIVNDTAIMKVDSDLDMIWAKRLNSHSLFVQGNDPVIEINGEINLVAVDTFGTELDSFYYSLITLDEDGNFIGNSDMIRGRDFGNVELQERGTNSFVFLDRSLATSIEGNNATITGQLDYAFCADTVAFCSSTMNTCIDNSLLMSGFYYEKPDSAMVFFMGKTDPKAALNCDEKKISPIDTLSRSLVQMDSIDFTGGDYELIQDTVAFEFSQFIPYQEMPCFNAVVEDQSQEYQPCPCDDQALSVSWLKGADYLWSTGDTTSFIIVDTSGTYTVTVNLCGTEVMSTFNVQYKTLSQCMIIQDNSPLCPGHITTLRVNHSYGDELNLQWSTGETEDSIHVSKSGVYTLDLAACGYTDQYSFNILYLDIENEDCKPVFIPNAFVPGSSQYADNKVFKIYTTLPPEAFTKFDMLIFDRWGEKVFQTDDAFGSWNGSYKNKNMPPGVYLYQISYEIDLGGELYSQSFNGQVILIR